MPLNSGLIERFIAAFGGNQRGHGYGNGKKGTKFIQEKNKWEYDKSLKGTLGWIWKKPDFKDYESHLDGDVALGIGSLRDDGKTERLELDVDHIGSDKYEFQYPEEMQKISQHPLPWVVFRTKSAGMRPTLFFSEPIEAELARRAGSQFVAQLGYSGNEIFPKQDKLIKEDDAPSWTFLPYGPTYGVFSEQVCMNESGNAMTLEEAMLWIESRRITRDMLLKHISVEHKVKADARIRGKKRHGNGVWQEEESYEATCRAMLCDGPICLWNIAKTRESNHRHDFLIAMGTFCKKKYWENWKMALQWANFNMCSPAGDPEKLNSIIRDLEKKDYEYRCKDQPIVDHCFAYACKNMRYGVGGGQGNILHEFGLTILLCTPRIIYVNLGEGVRAPITGRQLMNISLFREVCVEYGADFPDKMKQPDWDVLVRKALEEANYIEPIDILRTNAHEVGLIQRYFGMHIPNMVRRLGDAYLAGGGEPRDQVRMKIAERRVYAKWDGIEVFCRRSFNMGVKELQLLKLFIADKGQWHSRTEGKGWYRSTFSLSLDLFDPETVEVWLNGGEVKPEEEG
jgi:hypothetical protein